MVLQISISDHKHLVLSEKPSITFRDVLAPSRPPEDKKHSNRPR